MDSDVEEIVGDNNNEDQIPAKISDKVTGQVCPGNSGKDVNMVERHNPNKDSVKHFESLEKHVNGTREIKNTHDHRELIPSKVDENNMNNKVSSVQPIRLSQSEETAYTLALNKSSTVSRLPSAASSPVLPTLTDDMFVIEAPSFVLPYVYEKPSVIQIKEFVAYLGKDLKEKSIINGVENNNSTERKSSTIAALDLITGPNASEVQEAVKDLLNNKSLNISVSKKHNYDDDPLWEESASSDSENEKNPNRKLSKVKKLNVDSDVKSSMKTNPSEIENIPQSDNFFESSLGKFFIEIGDNFAQEYVLSDLFEQQKRKLGKENWSGTGDPKFTNECVISLITTNLEKTRKINSPYKLNQKKCPRCSFKSESFLVIARHLEVPHFKKGVYVCHICAFSNPKPQDVIVHMETEHNMLSRLEVPECRYNCPNCRFKDNCSRKFSRHQIVCAKKFNANCNLNPPAKWDPPAKLPTQTPAARLALTNKHSEKTVKNITAQSTPPLNKSANPRVSTLSDTIRPVTGAPLIYGGQVFQPSHLMVMPAAIGFPVPVPAIPYPPPYHAVYNRMPLTQSVVLPSLSGLPSTFVVCEICDGYITNLSNLYHHMQWIHKINIHPLTIYSQPPISCQKCSFMFFSEQGLERHLLGSHSLVTSAMVEAAKKHRDSGRCPTCGKIYRYNLLDHMTYDHKMSLKLAALCYKCKVCEATFEVYKLFEEHVRSMHRSSGPKASQKKKQA